MRRPSNKELYNKIEQAKENVGAATPDNHRLLQIDKDVIAMDATGLGYQAINLQPILIQLLSEIGIQHYVGNHPPQKIV